MILRAKKWPLRESPRRILAIRLQAIGDVVITLPYLKSLGRRRPDTEIDFLTRDEAGGIPQNVRFFHRVYSIGGGRSFKRQVLHVMFLLPRLVERRYDVVLDLQNNEISRGVRRFLRPKAWSEFDKLSPHPAGERTRETIEASGLGSIALEPGIPLSVEGMGVELLEEAGWRPGVPLVVLNPAGIYENRNWPLDNYVELAKLWVERMGEPTRFLILGTRSLESRARYLERRIGSKLINLVGCTTAAEAFSILQKATLVISEDSGLMHMGWVSGIPTLALFGSSRGDWSRPLGPLSSCLDSGDLPCGFCMEATCRHGDNHCLTRYEPCRVFESALELHGRKRSRMRHGAA